MTAPEPFLPRVFQAQEDGTTAIESHVDRNMYEAFRLVHTGPIGRRLGFSGRLVSLEFLLYTNVLTFRELKIQQPPTNAPKR